MKVIIGLGAILGLLVVLPAAEQVFAAGSEIGEYLDRKAARLIKAIDLENSGVDMTDFDLDKLQIEDLYRHTITDEDLDELMENLK